MTQLEYQRGLRKILTEKEPSFKLDSGAASFLDELLNDFNSDFVERCKSKSGAARNKNDEITSDDVRQAIREMFGSTMGCIATSIGIQWEEKYNEGNLTFDVAKAMIPDPKEKKVPTVMKKRAEPKPGAEFAQGLGKICEVLNVDEEDVSMSIKGKAYLQGVMLNVTKKIAQKVKDIHQDDRTLMPQDVADAVKEILSPDMFELAHDRGRQFLGYYRHNNLATFRIPRKESKETETESSEAGLPSENLRPSIFVTPLKHMLTRVYPDLPMQMTGKGCLKANELMWQVFNKITVAAKEADQGNSNELTPECLEMAIQQVMPQQMAAHCFVNSNIALDLYNRGVTRFKPSTKRPPLKSSEERTKEPSPKRLKKQMERKVEPKKVKSACKHLSAKKQTQIVQPVVETIFEKKDKPDLDFTKQILQLVAEMHGREFSIDRTTINSVNGLLQDLAGRIMDKVAEDGSRKEVKEIDAPEVEKAIAILFPKELKDCAMEEGRVALIRRKKLEESSKKA